MMQLAMYKGEPADLAHKLSHWFTKLFTKSEYSHCELVINGLAYSASARDGGVRPKLIDFSNGKWDLFNLPYDVDKEKQVKLWFINHNNQAYDWLGVFRFGLRFLPKKNNQWFCSEACAAALGIENSEEFTPQDLFEYLIKN